MNKFTVVFFFYKSITNKMNWKETKELIKGDLGRFGKINKSGG